MDLLIGFAVMLGAPAYLILQVMVPVFMPSMGWRTAALAPLLFSTPIIAWCLYALAQESNLWPLPFILFAPLGGIYLVGLVAVRFALRPA